MAYPSYQYNIVFNTVRVFQSFDHKRKLLDALEVRQELSHLHSLSLYKKILYT